MKKTLILTLFQLFIFFGCSSSDDGVVVQDPSQADSLETDFDKIVNADWQINKVSLGVEWKYNNFNDLFNSNQSITLFEFDGFSDNTAVEIAYVESGFLKTSNGAFKKNAVVAINGSFFNTKKGGSTVFFRNKGFLVNDKRSVAPYKANAGFAIDSSGVVSIIHKPTAGWASADYHTLLVSGPLIMSEGEVINQEDNDFNNNRHPRTSICVKKDNSLSAVVVDGRASQARGVTIEELSEIMKALGCQDAMNLDGGGSSTAWVKEKGVVNYPSDNKEFDHLGERGVSTVITFSEN